jgi:hypothetical protein
MAYLLKARTVKPTEMAVAREELCKHVSTATESHDCHSRHTGNSRRAVFSAVRSEAISGELKPVVSSQFQVYR